MDLKSIRKGFIVFAIAVAGGFLGGVLRESTKHSSEVIRASRFEVLGPSGKVLSYWGPDSDRLIPAATPKGILLVFMDPEGVRRAQIGGSLGSYAPELLFYGKDGPLENGSRKYTPEPRLNVGLGYNDDPFLTMRDYMSPRVLLGASHGDAPSAQEDDWRIAFVSRTGAVAYLGTHGVDSGRSQAFVSVRSDKGQSSALPPDFRYEIERFPFVPRSRP